MENNKLFIKLILFVIYLVIVSNIHLINIPYVSYIVYCTIIITMTFQLKNIFSDITMFNKINNEVSSKLSLFYNIFCCIYIHIIGLSIINFFDLGKYYSSLLDMFMLGLILSINIMGPIEYQLGILIENNEEKTK